MTSRFARHYLGAEQVKKSIIIGATIAVAAAVVALASGTASASQHNEHANNYIQEPGPNSGRHSLPMGEN